MTRVCCETKHQARPRLRAAQGATCIQLNAAASRAVVVELLWKSFAGMPMKPAGHVSPDARLEPGSMKMTAADNVRVLVLASTSQGGLACTEVFRKAGLQAEVCASFFELIMGLKVGVGAVFLAEEWLSGQWLDDLATWVARQPPWSDLPLVVLTSGEERPAVAIWRQHLITRLRNVVLLEEPVQPTTLASNALSAIRDRRRQYEVRAHLAERRQAAIAMQALIATRISELEAANKALCSGNAERERIEASLRQAQRIKAASRLTGSIAHDFSNMLQAISANLEMMRRRVEERRLDEAVRFVESAGAAVERAAALTCRLLASARRQALVPQIVGLDELVAGLDEQVRCTVGPAIEVDLRTNSGLWVVSCDPNHLEKALLSLAVSAREAMPEGGRLCFSTRPVCWGMADPTCQNDARPGEYVEIAVTDTGMGMDENTRAHVFEPFFDTEPAGQGTCSGLSQLYGFMQQSGGLVQLDSSPGQGTTVRLYLPRHRQAKEDTERGSGAEAGSVGNGMTLLLVGNEGIAREMAANSLREMGYEVLQAADGPTALDFLAAPVRIDLLVTDVGLPNGSNGRLVADAARERRPDLPVLFITGYAGSALERQLAPGMQVIGKPFMLETLAAQVGALMGRIMDPAMS